MAGVVMSRALGLRFWGLICSRVHVRRRSFGGRRPGRPPERAGEPIAVVMLRLGDLGHIDRVGNTLGATTIAAFCSPRPPHAGTPTEPFGELVEALLQRRGPTFGRKLSLAPRGARSGGGLGAIRPNRADRRRNAFSSADDDPTLRGVCSRRGSCAPGASAASLSGAVRDCSAPHGVCRHRGAVCCLARTT